MVYGEVPRQVQKMDSFMASFAQSSDSIKARFDDTLQNQGTILKMKATLREAEDDSVKVLAVKTRKEAKQIALRDSISATRVRIDELEKAVEARKARRDEYATIMFQHSLGMPGYQTKWQNSRGNKNLGTKVEGGRGNYMRLNVLDCNPLMNDTAELMNKLNRTNSLFKFVRTTREKFQDAALLGVLPQSTSLQESAAISVSAPGFLASISQAESLGKENDIHLKGNLRKFIFEWRLIKQSCRRSPRLVKRND